MRPPCEYVVKRMLPQIRARAARILIERHKWSAAEAARALGVSVPSVLKYGRIVAQPTELPEELLEKTAEELVEDVLSGHLGGRTVWTICRLCIKLRIGNMLCRPHREAYKAAGLEECDICVKWASVIGEEGEERIRVLENLREAVRMLTSSPEFALLIPEVRSNIAMAVEGAVNRLDVAAVPGRITVVRGMPVAVAEPEFGASAHLSKILLAVTGKRPKLRAVICVKYDDAIRKVLERLGFRTVFLRRKTGSDEELASDAAKEAARHEWIDAVIDLGGINIEPVTYVFGESAIEAARKALNIAREYLSITGETPSRAR